MTTTPDAQPERMSADELTETLNGFDEIAIRNAFGEHVSAMRAAKDELRFLRALIFIEKRRDGMKDAQAYRAAMEVRTLDLGDYFPDNPDEIDPEDPVSVEGKDDTPPE